ncbi:lanosterol synthase [Aspergillus eucalypticola CBS 122712]|uniref:Terpene cyclase/mutase family member n=1 Tax=Aspergillus eucalypticola (strain CBS 122712 / IBT 29274) TaxID=1448314 RepID=A0A317V4B9_ASPEC|nr:lanosterol synthase [Aspergillus eucalypticola CBS 122712]PWY68806.1 lanosterol synthase [Aspergillus eucalypticola CBS 122712]
MASKYTLKIKNRLSQNGSGDLCPSYTKMTDIEGWHLVTTQDLGRLRWVYLKDKDKRSAQTQDATSKFFLDIPMDHQSSSLPANTVSEAIYKGVKFHTNTQVRDLGCWAADLSCIFFVTPMLVMTWYITGARIDEAYVIELIRFMFNCQNPDNGGWATYLEEDPSPMGTTLVYIALRLMGVPPDNERLRKAREFYLSHGGALYLPAWAKFWLALLGLYDWAGTDPYPVEMWLLPKWFPLSPWNWYVIPRQVYLPMCYLSSRRFTLPTNDLLDEIRAELFPQKFSAVNFAAYEGVVRPSKRHQAKSWMLQLLNWILTNVWNPWLCPSFLKKKAEERAWDIVLNMDNASNSTGLISMDAWLNMIAVYCGEGPNSPALKHMQETSLEYLWMGSSGMQSMSIHGGHAWDTSLALQTLVYTGLAEHKNFQTNTQRAYEYLIQQQLVNDWDDASICHRPSRLGAWSFTTRYHGSPCSDCTAESLKAILMVERKLGSRQMREANLRLAVDNLLMIQNHSGGYSSFEPIAAGNWLEYFNGTEMFGQVMTEHDYVECTSSCVTALALFRARNGEYRRNEVDRAIERGVKFVETSQRDDGSWMASWGITFTYGAFFAMEALHYGGRTYENSSVVRAGCRFLLDMRESDGGWGETLESRMVGTYVHAPRSHTVQTAWSCLALMYAGYPDPEPIKRGIYLIINRQKPNGKWEQEYPVGSGVLTCHIQYHNYIYSFPIRALAMYEKLYGNGPII